MSARARDYPADSARASEKDQARVNLCVAALLLSLWAWFSAHV
ncbi:hypothetical protein FM125_01215 [Micrococcus lylae]|uniref:Uncharacterized protein n=1 Tax=Micrococcus lylae TaxID=1273 RepID=A0A1R4IAS2_9MICC|nr:hypothetical protein FM125_01215 [Micrococcus lylae]